MKFSGKVRVIENRELQSDIFQLVVERPLEVLEINPGQFFNIIASETGYPLLRRPISISGYDSKTIEFTIKVLGIGTHALSKVESGDLLDMTGPLGNGFIQSDEKNILVVGGGIGIAPLKGLIEKGAQSLIETDIILGYRDKPFISEAFFPYANSLTIVSENDEHYRKGYVTQPFMEKIDSNSYDMVYACGPEIMLKTLAKICNERKIEIQLLMEEKMACGVGACLVCTCKTKQGEFGFKHVRMCTEGPMLYGREVIFDED